MAENYSFHLVLDVLQRQTQRERARTKRLTLFAISLFNVFPLEITVSVKQIIVNSIIIPPV